MSRTLFRQVPNLYFPTQGSSDGISELNAFDSSLLAAGIGDTNLVKMSSIIPPSCKKVDPFRLPFGSLVPVAYASITSSKPGQWLSAAVACAIPEDPMLAGLIMEHHDFERASVAEGRVREMVLSGMKERNREIREIVSVSSEHQVETCGAVFAGMVLWWSDV